MAKLQERLEFSMKDKYEVGYGKPPKATRFGNRPQPKRSAKSPAIDLAKTINRPVTVTRNGKRVRIHPHEAMMRGLLKSALGGKLRAIKQFLSTVQESRPAGSAARASNVGRSYHSKRDSHRTGGLPCQYGRTAALG